MSSPVDAHLRSIIENRQRALDKLLRDYNKKIGNRMASVFQKPASSGGKASLTTVLDGLAAPKKASSSPYAPKSPAKNNPAYKNMKVRELKKLAMERGLKRLSKKPKDTVIAALIEYNKRSEGKPQSPGKVSGAQGQFPLVTVNTKQVKKAKNKLTPPKPVKQVKKAKAPGAKKKLTPPHRVQKIVDGLMQKAFGNLYVPTFYGGDRLSMTSLKMYDKERRSYLAEKWPPAPSELMENLNKFKHLNAMISNMQDALKNAVGKTFADTQLIPRVEELFSLLKAERKKVGERGDGLGKRVKDIMKYDYNSLKDMYEYKKQRFNPDF
jgi:hypothetical protein